jgi:DNA polymerase-3 subunit alpha
VKRFATHTCASLANAGAFEKVSVGGIVTGWRERLTKTGKKIAFASLEDLTGTRDLVLYDDVVQKFESLLKSEDPLLIKGAVRLAEKFGAQQNQESEAEPSPEIKVEEVLRLSDVRAAKSTRVEVRVQAEQATPEKLLELKNLLSKHPGACLATLTMFQPGAFETRLNLKGTKVAPDDDLFAAVDRLFGAKVCGVR